MEMSVISLYEMKSDESLGMWVVDENLTGRDISGSGGSRNPGNLWFIFRILTSLLQLFMGVSDSNAVDGIFSGWQVDEREKF